MHHPDLTAFVPAVLPPELCQRLIEAFHAEVATEPSRSWRRWPTGERGPPQWDAEGRLRHPMMNPHMEPGVFATRFRLAVFAASHHRAIRRLARGLIGGPVRLAQVVLSAQSPALAAHVDRLDLHGQLMCMVALEDQSRGSGRLFTDRQGHRIDWSLGVGDTLWWGTDVVHGSHRTAPGRSRFALLLHFVRGRPQPMAALSRDAVAWAGHRVLSLEG